MKRFTVLAILILTLISGLAFAEEVATNPPTPPAAEQAVPAPAAPTVEAAPAAPKIDTGDTAWMIVATASCHAHDLAGSGVVLRRTGKEERHSQHDGNVFCHLLHCKFALGYLRILICLRN